MTPLLRSFALAVAFASSTLHVRSAGLPETPQELWKNFDPRTEPLEIQIDKQWKAEGADYIQFHFTGFTRDARKVRVLGFYSAPEGGKNLPAILHIHGGGQSYSLPWLKFWNSRGYAAMTFDWWGHAEATDWAGVRRDPLEESVLPDPTLSPWYMETQVARRALTVLEQQPQVDPKRLGIFGISMGGTLTWFVAGTDPRVKAACAIYGVGWNSYLQDPKAPDPKKNDPEMILRRKIMEPEAYAPLVRCPILFLDATNDHWGKFEKAYETLSRVTTEHRIAFTPHFMHYVADEQGTDLLLWMDTWLKNGQPVWPATPGAKLAIGANGVPLFTVTPADAAKVKKVDVYYAEEDLVPRLRHWREPVATRNGPSWTAELPVLDTKNPVTVFANVLYENGISLSSQYCQSVPARLATSARATLSGSNSILSDFSKGAVDWSSSAVGTDPIPPNPPRFKILPTPDGKPGIAANDREDNRLQTFRIGDVAFHPPEGAKLTFVVYAKTPGDLTVSAMKDAAFAFGKEIEFTKVIPLDLNPAGQTITLSAKDFSYQGKPLENWDGVRGLGVMASGATSLDPIYTGFRWVP